MKEDKLFLRKKLREIIRGMIREISTTSGAGGYLTPKAFVKDEKSKLAFDKHMAKLIGGTLAQSTAAGTQLIDIIREIAKKAKSIKKITGGHPSNFPAHTQRKQGKFDSPSYVPKNPGKFDSPSYVPKNPGKFDLPASVSAKKNQTKF
jgi:hypothetical protein